MSRPAPSGATLTIPTGASSGVTAFEAACERRDFVLLQQALEGMPVSQAVTHLATLFPAHTVRWYKRYYPHLMALTPDDFAKALDYADPTGDTAVKNVLTAWQLRAIADRFGQQLRDADHERRLDRTLCRAEESRDEHDHNTPEREQ